MVHDDLLRSIASCMLFCIMGKVRVNRFMVPDCCWDRLDLQEFDEVGKVSLFVTEFVRAGYRTQI